MPRTASPARSTGGMMDTEKGRKALRYIVYLTLVGSLVVTVVYGSMAVHNINEAHKGENNPNPFVTDNTSGIGTGSANDLSNKDVRDFQTNSFSALLAFAFALLLSVLSLHFRV